MSKKFVKRISLVEAICVTPDTSIEELKKFTGAKDVTTDSEAVYIFVDTNIGVCATFGDFLVKDSKGCLYPVPCDIFGHQFIEVGDV